MRDSLSLPQTKGQWIWGFLGRTVLWAVSMATLWSLPSLTTAFLLYCLVVFGGITGSAPSAVSSGSGDAAVFYLLIGVVLRFLVFAMVRGAITGITASWCAPASSHWNPLTSAYFKTIGAKTYQFCLVTVPLADILTLVCFFALTSATLPTLRPGWLTGIPTNALLLSWLIPICIGFFVALNRAVRLVLAQNLSCH